MRYLGIDYGLRYAGLALGDDETRLASPFKTIDQTREHIFASLKKIIADEGADAIVVGMPVYAIGSHEQEEYTRMFIAQLRTEIDLPVHEWNEQFTSKESRRRISEGSDADEHSIAAMIILQSYLDNSLNPKP